MAASEHPLATYMASQGESLRSLAEKADTTATSLSRIINYKQDPSLGLIRRLIAVSAGELTADDFLPTQKHAAPQPDEAAA